MATKYINIEQGELDPSSVTVYPGDDVVFQMSGRTDIVTVAFSPDTPFSVSQFQLNGGVAQQASQDKTVVTQTTKDYPFKVYPGTSVPPRHWQDPEPPGTLSGDI